MSISVFSEIGQLKKVMLHRPGNELEHLVPGELQTLLFDDIPYLEAAQREHDTFADTLRAQGTEVVYLEDMMAETLKANPTVKEEFIDQFILEGGGTSQIYKEELRDLLLSVSDEKELVLRTMSGIEMEELTYANRVSPLAGLLKDRHHFALNPMPNLYFTRDPFACIGNGVSVHKMYSTTRSRETIYGDYIFKYHPVYSQDTIHYYERTAPLSLEGGDILVLSKEVIAVGISQRTTPEAIERLALNIFGDENASIRRIIAVNIPNIRAFMHLDTVLTQIDKDKFVVHPGILGDTLRIFEIRPDGTNRLKVVEHDTSIEEVLKDALGLSEVTLIRCGGGDRVAAEREQWNDGSNTLCVAPGRVIVYDRNSITNQILRENGIEVLEIPGSELSRGRGGPRCMSMPLKRVKPAVFL